MEGYGVYQMSPALWKRFAQKSSVNTGRLRMIKTNAWKLDSFPFSDNPVVGQTGVNGERLRRLGQQFVGTFWHIQLLDGSVFTWASGRRGLFSVGPEKLIIGDWPTSCKYLRWQDRIGHDKR